MNKIILITLLILTTYTTANKANNKAEELEAAETGSIVGTVLDSKTSEPVEYANIAIYSKSDSTLITGGITDENGKFNIETLKPGQYYVTIKFIGYEETIRPNIMISRQERMANIGIIKLIEAQQNLGALDVVADRQQVLYKIDKKIVNPSQFISAQGGSAVDILANTPSVTVDIEGNVSLRGSGNFMVLINGRPTPFEASDALAQIPASTIENIEIITNPSAKYDPDGASGIINIITKKNSQRGWNGVLNANASTQGSLSGDFLFNFNKDKFNYYFGANRSDRLRNATYTSDNGNTINQDTFYIHQFGDRLMNFYSNSLKTGVNYSINDKNQVGIQLEGGLSGRKFTTDLTSEEWTNSEAHVKTSSIGDTKAQETFGTATLTQSSQFGSNKEHKLESSLFYQYSEGVDESLSEKRDELKRLSSSQKSWSDSKSSEFRASSDYTHPLENGKIEAGYQLRLDDTWSNYDAAFLPAPENIESYYNETQFFRLINSVYSTFSGTKNRLGYQFGLRAEHTLRKLDDNANDTIYKINRLDWYPTLHLSYDLKSEQQIMASYSRRIDRPRSHHLDPYIEWRDANNVRRGNPGLLPQYINSFELSYQKSFGYNSINIEMFHRNVTNKDERVRSSYAPNVILSSYDNVGKDYSTGLEAMLNYSIAKWWQVNVSGSYYDYRLDVSAEYEATIRERSSTNWNARISNTFKPATNTRIQLDGMYNSASVSAQGTRGAMAFSSIAVKQTLFKRKMDASVSLVDIFNTAKMKSNTKGENFYSNYTYDMKSPYLTFTLSYRFNNFKPERKERSEGGGMEMDF